MTKIIKEVTLKEIQLIQESGKKEIDVSAMMTDLQARIIINIAVGMGYSKTLVEWENDNGTFTQRSLQDVLSDLMSFTIARDRLATHMLLPELIRYAYQPSDRRYKRNVMRFRAILQKMIDERRSGATKGYMGDTSADVLSILL